MQSITFISAIILLVNCSLPSFLLLHLPVRFVEVTGSVSYGYAENTVGSNGECNCTMTKHSETITPVELYMYVVMQDKFPQRF